MTRLLTVLGTAMFMASIALLGWWWISLGGTPLADGGVSAAAIDTALFSAFALHHSLLARTPAKQLVERWVPHALVRTTYVCAASILLAVMCLAWQRTGGEVYRASGLVAGVLNLLQGSGVVVGVLAVRRISIAELAGLHPATPSDTLQAGGPYRFVRHPLYLGWVLMVFGPTHMTGDRLVFASISTVYILIAMPFEEAGLHAQFRERYAEYRRAVRWRLIPYIH